MKNSFLMAVVAFMCIASSATSQDELDNRANGSWENHSVAVIKRGKSVSDLPSNPRDDVSGFATHTNVGSLPLSEYINSSPTDGVIIIHKGLIVFEDYPRMQARDKHMSFSISKVFASTLIAILEEKGIIDVQNPVNNYLEELNGSAWDGIPIIDILDMSTGINCREKEEEAYENPNSCFRKFHEACGLFGSANAWENPVDFLLTMDKFEPNGLKYDYTGINTFVLSWLAERVSGQTYSDLLSGEIWQHLGAESDAEILTGSRGTAAVSFGLMLTLRDLGRFGLQFTPSGRDDPHAIITEEMLRKIQFGGRPELFQNGYGFNHFRDDTPISHNTYQWDHVTLEGDFFKSGWGGQGLYISPGLDLVIAFFGSHDEDSYPNQMPEIARQLAKSGLFK